MRCGWRGTLQEGLETLVLPAERCRPRAPTRPQTASSIQRRSRRTGVRIPSQSQRDPRRMYVGTFRRFHCIPRDFGGQMQRNTAKLHTAPRACVPLRRRVACALPHTSPSARCRVRTPLRAGDADSVAGRGSMTRRGLCEDDDIARRRRPGRLREHNCRVVAPGCICPASFSAIRAKNMCALFDDFIAFRRAPTETRAPVPPHLCSSPNCAYTLLQPSTTVRA